ncbi:unnamed protein product [Phyllotreta striolata]|uniref:Uncharacterized protein n=1 Tax=Phyllotreta striolata TaxID=444603 RepID=A0A9N9TS65_PHYSR|nr:unnamed protein product [Phyllotreta striolata]
MSKLLLLGNILIFVLSTAIADKMDDWQECVESKGLTMMEVFYATEENHEILCVAKCLMMKMLEAGESVSEHEKEILEPLECD